MNTNRTNEEKLDLFADLIEPAGAIIADREWAMLWQAHDRAGAIKSAIRNHKDEIVEILARIEGADPHTYTIDGLSLFFRLAALFRRPDLEGVADLFTSQDQTGAGASSGPATEDIQGGAQ